MQDTDKPKGTSNRNIEYKCSICGRVVGRENLKVKQVQFKTMGLHGSVEKKRTVGWLCVTPQPDGSASCLDRDEAWNLPRLAASPGMADTHLAKDLAVG